MPTSHISFNSSLHPLFPSQATLAPCLSMRVFWVYSCLRNKLALPFIWNTLSSGFCMSISLSFRPHRKHYTLRKVISNLTNCTSLLLFHGDIHHMTLVYFFFIELMLNHIVKCFLWLSTVPSPHTIKLHGKGNSSMHPLLSSAYLLALCNYFLKIFEHFYWGIAD